MVGKYNKDKIALKFKDGGNKCYQCKLYAVLPMYKNLIKEFLEDLRDRNVLQKAKSAKLLSHIFCQDKKGGEFDNLLI